MQLTETTKAYLHASKHPSCTYAPLSKVFLATQNGSSIWIFVHFRLTGKQVIFPHMSRFREKQMNGKLYREAIPCFEVWRILALNVTVALLDKEI